jgi:di/tricarboxylate transporter
MATALILIPISISAAADLHVSAKPLLTAGCVAAAAAFLTSTATPVVAVLLVPVIWSF